MINLGSDNDETQPLTCDEEMATAISATMLEGSKLDPACKQLKFEEKKQEGSPKSGASTLDAPAPTNANETPAKVANNEYQPPPLPEKPAFLENQKKTSSAHQPSTAAASSQSKP